MIAFDGSGFCFSKDFDVNFLALVLALARRCLASCKVAVVIRNLTSPGFRQTLCLTTKTLIFQDFKFVQIILHGTNQ